MDMIIITKNMDMDMKEDITEMNITEMDIID
jgi:hypothetical protein